MKKEFTGTKTYSKARTATGSGRRGNADQQSRPGSRYTRRDFIKLAGAGVTGVCLGGMAGSLIPAGAHAAEAPVYGGTLKIGMNADVVGLDPHVATAQSSHIVLHHVCDSLLAIDASVTPQANLAERWETLDGGMRYRFYLKQGVSFHNGQKNDGQRC